MYSVHNKLIMSLFLENCTLLSCYEVSSGNFLPTFRYNLLVLFSRVNKLKRKPTVQIRSLCVNSVDGDVIVLRITDIAILSDKYR